MDRVETPACDFSSDFSSHKLQDIDFFIDITRETARK